MFVQLMSGSQMPLTGFGTWKLREPELEPAIRAALKVGYRHFDGAAIYENESELGHVFQSIISNEQFVSRSELFITSKLWVTSMKPRSVRPACEQSLKDWKMDYFDLYLIHWPFCFKSDTKTGSTLYDVHGVAIIDEECQIEDTWREMEKLVQAGLVKNIGVSNFSLNLLKRILAMSDLKIIPAVNQVELHPYLQQRELRDYCNGMNIVVEAYSSLGSGKTAPYLLADETFIEIAKDLKISTGSLLLSWSRQQGIPVIPKSCNPCRISDNYVHHPLPSGVIEKINSVPKVHRYIDPMNFWKHSIPQ